MEDPYGFPTVNAGIGADRGYDEAERVRRQLDDLAATAESNRLLNAGETTENA